MKQLLKNFHFEFMHAFDFSCTRNKEASFCRKNVEIFRHNIAYMITSYVVLFDILD